MLTTPREDLGRYAEIDKDVANFDAALSFDVKYVIVRDDSDC